MEIGVLKKPDNKKYPFVQKKDEYNDVIKIYTENKWTEKEVIDPRWSFIEN